MKILLVAENCSRRMGGEAILPYHYFRLLSAKGHQVRLLTHGRNRQEVGELFPDQGSQISYIDDTPFQITLWRWGERLPRRVAETTLWFLVLLSSSSRMKTLAKSLVAEHSIDVVHQVIPVSPKAPSHLWGLGAPVIIGPMNGGMVFPDAFRGEIRLSERLSYAAAKALGALVNVFIPGKRRAELLLAANPRTEASLREVVGPQRPVVLEVENGVDLTLWKSPGDRILETAGPARFVFVGRLVDWKGVDYLLQAYRELVKTRDCTLEIIGDGDQRERLQSLSAEWNLLDRVTFHGFLAQDQVPPLVASSRALVLPSLFECGGAVVLEAMALSKAVVATGWGGPADYLDDDCGILVPPVSREALVEGFTAAMARLADNPALADRLGRRGRAKIEEQYDWDKKVDAMLSHYRSVLLP